MANKTTRVLVVDDSQTIRELICESLERHADLCVVGVAADGQQALDQMASLRPDVITLDLQMPRMDGLTTLDRILQDRPVPVIVVSSLTQRAAETTMQALQQGALDYVAKPEGIESMRRVFGEELPAKIRNMAGADVRRILQFRKSREVRNASEKAGATSAVQARQLSGCIAIGISTGGPPALSHLFSDLVPPLPPIVVVQHMPAMFTKPFANRLNSLSSLTICEAADGDILRPNCAYIAPGGKHLSLRQVGQDIAIRIFDGDFVSGHKPSVDVMMESAAKTFGKRCIGVIMTGMGRDGATGCGAVRAHGGFVLGQDESSSDVYGMNKVAFSEGNVDRQLPLEQLAAEISATARARCSRAKSTQLLEI